MATLGQTIAGSAQRVGGVGGDPQAALLIQALSAIGRSGRDIADLFDKMEQRRLRAREESRADLRLALQREAAGREKLLSEKRGELTDLQLKRERKAAKEQDLIDKFEEEFNAPGTHTFTKAQQSKFRTWVRKQEVSPSVELFQNIAQLQLKVEEEAARLGVSPDDDRAYRAAMAKYVKPKIAGIVATSQVLFGDDKERAAKYVISKLGPLYSNPGLRPHADWLAYEALGEVRGRADAAGLSEEDVEKSFTEGLYTDPITNAINLTIDASEGYEEGFNERRLASATGQAEPLGPPLPPGSPDDQARTLLSGLDETQQAEILRSRGIPFGLREILPERDPRGQFALDNAFGEPLPARFKLIGRDIEGSREKVAEAFRNFTPEETEAYLRELLAESLRQQGKQ
jgi:hypothetical protein